MTILACMWSHCLISRGYYSLTSIKSSVEEKEVISDSLMSLEWLVLGLLSVDNDHSGTQESVVVFQLHLTHTANYWSRRHPPFPTHSHTIAPRGWPFQPIFSLAPRRQAGNGSVYACSTLSLSLSWNRGPCRVLANTLDFHCSSSPATSGYCCLQPL